MFISFRGWSIIEEKLSISEFVDLDSIIEQFCKLRPKDSLQILSMKKFCSYYARMES